MVKQTIALDPRRRRHALPVWVPPWLAAANQARARTTHTEKSQEMRKMRELPRPDRAIHEKLKNSAPHHEDTVRFSSCMRQSGMEEGRVSKTQRGFYRMGGAGGWLGCMDRRHDKWRQRPWHAAAARRRTHGPSSSLVCNSAAGSNLNTRGYRDTDTTHVPVKLRYRQRRRRNCEMEKGWTGVYLLLEVHSRSS